MAKTEIHGWPLPELTASANVPQDLKNLADAFDRQVPFVCTADTRPAPYAGLVIYETDTQRTFIGTGSKFNILGQPWRSYTPAFNGWASLGSNPTRSGEYSIAAGGLVTVRARLKSGSGSVLGSGRLNFTLPFSGSSAVQEFGKASFLQNGPNGFIRTALVVGGGGSAAEFWMENGTSPVSTPGSAGMPWGANSECHVNYQFQANFA